MNAMRITTVLFILAASGSAYGAESCKSSPGYKTPVGQLIEMHCTTADDLPVRASISINGAKLVEDERLSAVDTGDKSNLFWLFSGGIDKTTFCIAQFHLIDLSTNPPTATTFGVRNACNQFDWASWSKGGGVIALKKNVRFKYRYGKMTTPKVDEAFLQTVAMPENTSDSGIVAATLVPFARPAASAPSASK